MGENKMSQKYGRTRDIAPTVPTFWRFFYAQEVMPKEKLLGSCNVQMIFIFRK